MQVKENVYSSFLLDNPTILYIRAQFSDHVANDSSSEVDEFEFLRSEGISKLVTLSTLRIVRQARNARTLLATLRMGVRII
jgi:hypothetical protein